MPVSIVCNSLLRTGQTRIQGAQADQPVNINDLQSELFHGGWQPKFTWDLKQISSVHSNWR